MCFAWCMASSIYGYDILRWEQVAPRGDSAVFWPCPKNCHRRLSLQSQSFETKKKLKTIVFTNNAFRPLAVMAVDWETLTPRGKSVNPWAQVIEKNVMALSREMARESQSAFDTYREILDHLFNCLQNGYHRLYR